MSKSFAEMADNWVSKMYFDLIGVDNIIGRKREWDRLGNVQRLWSLDLSGVKGPGELSGRVAAVQVVACMAGASTVWHKDYIHVYGSWITGQVYRPSMYLAAWGTVINCVRECWELDLALTRYGVEGRYNRTALLKQHHLISLDYPLLRDRSRRTRERKQRPEVVLKLRGGGPRGPQLGGAVWDQNFYRTDEFFAAIGLDKPSYFL